MTEYIERELAINLFYPVDPENDGTDGCTVICKSGNYSSADIEGMLSELPAADVAPVVYCRECKCCRGFGGVTIEPGEVGICGLTGMCVEPNDFCSYGERKDGDE